jgi:5-formyltetrahydrofolate cyclo-ligase
MAQRPPYASGYGVDWPRPRSTSALFSTASQISSRARVVKYNPDAPQIPLRLRALYDSKLLFSPVPYLSKGFPYLCIDPDKLAAKGADFESAGTPQGFMEHGEPIGFEAMSKLHFCVVGCVAVTRSGGRRGKGAGFEDLK